MIENLHVANARRALAIADSDSGPQLDRSIVVP